MSARADRPAPPRVCVIVLNWNGRADTLACLSSLARQRYQNAELVVVDNGSSDGSVDAIRAAHPGLTILETGRNLGYTGGNNHGIGHAIASGAEYAWLLNNDTVVDPEALARLVAAAAASPEVGLVSPVVRFEADGRLQSAGRHVDGRRWALVDVVDPDAASAGPGPLYLVGTALLVRVQMAQRIGVLDDAFFAYWEDMEYSRRAVTAGYRTVLEPSATVFHKTPLPEANRVTRSPGYFYYMTRNKYLFWMRALRGIDRIRFVQRYIGDAIADAADCHARGSAETRDACLDGLWSALRGVTGPRERAVVMPRPLRALILRQPYLWVGLFRYRPLELVGRLLNRAHRRRVLARETS